METYEIRILREDGTTAFTIPEVHLSDRSAIRSARLMARGRPFEVWCGIDCIFGHSSEPAPRSRGPTLPAA